MIKIESFFKLKQYFFVNELGEKIKILLKFSIKTYIIYLF